MMRRLPLALPALLLLAGCATSAGNEETDRIAQVVTDAISWPAQDDAMAYARAAASTAAAEDGRLTVIGVTELEDREDAFAELELLVHLEGSTGGWNETDPVDACYRVAFGAHGAVDSPDRVTCPEDPTPVDIPALPPRGPVAELPEGADEALDAQLRRLREAVDVASLQAALERSLPAAPGALPADIQVEVVGSDVGVSVRGEGQCLLGSRVDGAITVWRPSAVQLQPGELTCDPGTALSALGQQPPH